MEIKKFIFFIITIILEILQKWQIKFQQFVSTIKLLFTKFLEIDKYSQTTESIPRFSLAIKIYISILSWIFEVSFIGRGKKERDRLDSPYSRKGGMPLLGKICRKRNTLAGRRWTISLEKDHFWCHFSRQGGVGFIRYYRSSLVLRTSAPAGARSSLVPAESRCSDPVSPNVSRQIYDPPLR